MPTRNRRRFVEQALACFLAQDWQHRELIVVDDGEPVRDLIPSSPMFSYVHLGDVHRTIGAKRNAACQLARGEYIVHWDDDDWSGPQRISEQVRVLRQSAKPATGYNYLPFAWDEGRRAWLYLGRQGYACGTSLMYLRAYWAGHRFPDIQIGEDNEFLSRLGDRFVSASGRQIAARIHGEATCPKIAMLTGEPWTGAPGQSWQEIQYEQLARCGYPIAEAVANEQLEGMAGHPEHAGRSCPAAGAAGSGDDGGELVRRPQSRRHGGRQFRRPACDPQRQDVEHAAATRH
jgi:hypothetical protein